MTALRIISNNQGLMTNHGKEIKHWCFNLRWMNHTFSVLPSYCFAVCYLVDQSLQLYVAIPGQTGSSPTVCLNATCSFSHISNSSLLCQRCLYIMYLGLCISWGGSVAISLSCIMLQIFAPLTLQLDYRDHQVEIFIISAFLFYLQNCI